MTFLVAFFQFYRLKLLITVAFLIVFHNSFSYHNFPHNSKRSVSNKKFTKSFLSNSALLHKPSFTVTTTLQLNSKENDNNELEEQDRIEAIRHIQRAFYQDEGRGVQPPQPGSIYIRDLPLWCAEWTEIPGYQTVFNVDDPTYTNMFHKIINSKDVSSLYFGHLYLPEGLEPSNKDDIFPEANEKFEEKDFDENMTEGLTGMLMQISDYKQLDDGSLTLIVQALERFRVVKTKNHHLAYIIATVEMIPDKELIQTLNEPIYPEYDIYDGEDGREGHENFLSKAVEEAFQWHSFEVRPVTIEESTIVYSDDKDPLHREEIDVSTLANYDKRYLHDAPLFVKSYAPPSNIIQTTVEELEYSIWVQVDEVIKLLHNLVGSNEISEIPIPTQLLGLLPKYPPRAWPSDFILDSYATSMEEKKSHVGTTSLSPFVRVDDLESYPPLRRAQRLSYAIWVLTDSILNGGVVQNQQDLLEIESIAERLQAAKTKLTYMVDHIRLVLNEN